MAGKRKPKAGSIEQKRQSALIHRIEACEIRGELRRMTGNEHSAWRRAARIHESLVREYTRDIAASRGNT